MAFPGVPEFQTGLMMQDGTQMQAFVHNTLSVDINLKAHQGGGQQFATLVDAVVNVVSRVTTAGDSVQLPPTNGRRGFGPFLGGLQLLIINSTGNACQVFGNFFETCTIGGIAGTTGISVPGGSSLQLVCGAAGIWISIVGAAGGGLPFTGGQLTGGLGLTSATSLTATGSTQTDALLVNTQIVVVTSFPTGTGIRLPASGDLPGGALGPTFLYNKDSALAGLVYPPVGGQIDSQGTNIAISLPSKDNLVLSPSGTNQWWS